VKVAASGSTGGRDSTGKAGVGCNSAAVGGGGSELFESNNARYSSWVNVGAVTGKSLVEGKNRMDTAVSVK